MKLFFKIILLAIIDFIIIRFWVMKDDPEPSATLGLIILVPFAVGINLLIATVLFFTKRNEVKLFIINAVVSGLLMYYLFLAGAERYANLHFETWKFTIKDTIFHIVHWKSDSSFTLCESTNPGSSTSFLDGKFITKGCVHYLTTDSTKYIIKKSYLYEFREDSIKLTKRD